MTNENVKHYTPQMAREESKDAFNWRDYVQEAIDEYVPKAVKDAKYEVDVQIRKPENFDYKETLEHVQIALEQLGWGHKPSSRNSGIGNVNIKVCWEDQ